MTQYALPVIDAGRTNWIQGAGNGNASHSDELDEGFGLGRGTGVGPDDATTYWVSAGAINQLATALSAVDDPLGNVGHIFRSRSRKDLAGGRQVDFVLQVLDPAIPAVVRASQTFVDIDTVWTTRTITLSAAEADAVSSYTSLGIRVSATRVGGGPVREVYESAHEFECPDAPAVPEIGWLLQASDIFSAPPSATAARGMLATVNFVPPLSFGWFPQITTIPHFGLPYLTEGATILTPVLPIPELLPPSPDLNIPPAADVIRVPDKVVSY